MATMLCTLSIKIIYFNLDEGCPCISCQLKRKIVLCMRTLGIGARVGWKGVVTIFCPTYYAHQIPGWYQNGLWEVQISPQNV